MSSLLIKFKPESYLENFRYEDTIFCYNEVKIQLMIQYLPKLREYMRAAVKIITVDKNDVETLLRLQAYYSTIKKYNKLFLVNVHDYFFIEYTKTIQCYVVMEYCKHFYRQKTQKRKKGENKEKKFFEEMSKGKKCEIYFCVICESLLFLD